MGQARKILKALGGADNIIDLEPCITRLRVEVKDGGDVDEEALRSAGAHAVMRAGNVIQVVVGPEADDIADEIEEMT